MLILFRNVPYFMYITVILFCVAVTCCSAVLWELGVRWAPLTNSNQPKWHVLQGIHNKQKYVSQKREASNVYTNDFIDIAQKKTH